MHYSKFCSTILLALREHADVAQSVERILGKDEVTSSNLVISSEELAEMQVLFFVFGRKMQDLCVHPAFLHLVLNIGMDSVQNLVQKRLLLKFTYYNMY